MQLIDACTVTVEIFLRATFPVHQSPDARINRYTPVGVRCHACNSTRSPGQRNTWLELVIKCSRQFRKRVTVTVCNCRTLRGFQFGRAAPRICILCVLYATRILSCNGYYEIRSRGESLSLSLSSSLSRLRLPSTLKCRYKRVTSVPLDVVMSSTFHRTALHLWTMPERYAISFHLLVSVREQPVAPF